MTKKRITSRPGLFGYTYHYDENGKCIGKSRPGLLTDVKIHYDSNGRQFGTSRPGFFVKEVYHDQVDDRYISSFEGLSGDVHFENGKLIGVSHPGFSETEYTWLDTKDESTPEHVDCEEYTEDNSGDVNANNKSNTSTGLQNTVIFIGCCLLVGILILIFK